MNRGSPISLLEEEDCILRYVTQYPKVPNKQGEEEGRRGGGDEGFEQGGGLEICVKYDKQVGVLEYPGGRKMVNRVPLRLV